METNLNVIFTGYIFERSYFHNLQMQNQKYTSHSFQEKEKNHAHLNWLH